MIFEDYARDAVEAFALYQSMRTEELITLRAAHELDLVTATRPESIAFGGGRLALIAAVLKARGAHPGRKPRSTGNVSDTSQT